MPLDYNDCMIDAGDFVQQFMDDFEDKFREFANMGEEPLTTIEERQMASLKDHLAEFVAGVLFRISRTMKT